MCVSNPWLQLKYRLLAGFFQTTHPHMRTKGALRPIIPLCWNFCNPNRKIILDIWDSSYYLEFVKFIINNSVDSYTATIGDRDTAYSQRPEVTQVVSTKQLSKSLELNTIMSSNIKKPTLSLLAQYGRQYSSQYLLRIYCLRSCI